MSAVCNSPRSRRMGSEITGDSNKDMPAFVGVAPLVPVFGPKALDVSPRIGHLHVAVDGAPWVWAETSGGPLIIAGLPAGPHKVEITLVNPNHQPLDRSVVVEFVIPGGKAAK